MKTVWISWNSVEWGQLVNDNLSGLNALAPDVSHFIDGALCLLEIITLILKHVVEMLHECNILGFSSGK